MTADPVDAADPSIGRRSLLGLAAATAVPAPAARAAPAAATPAAAGGIRAMTFDIQGTVFDYYQPFLATRTALDARKGRPLDWSGFLADWNAGAASAIQAIIAGTRPWIPPGRIYREALDTPLAARGLAGQMDETDRLELMSVWGRMLPWPDSAEGIGRLRRKVTVAALSNAGMAAVIALARRGGLAFDAVLSGELVRSYKPAPEVYRAAATYLGFAPGEIMMVAAHKFDLRAAKEAGFATAYIPRPRELGPETHPDRAPESFIDIVADDLLDLAARLGAG
ncbi:MAG TPA: haloacid dehalogenase type II [Roseomonas sp.]|jgi:2-haloacid dehalogenase